MEKLINLSKCYSRCNNEKCDKRNNCLRFLSLLEEDKTKSWIEQHDPNGKCYLEKK